MLLERRAARRGLQLLEVGRERERVGVEERELLLDGEREVLALVEAPRVRSASSSCQGFFCASPIEAGTLLERFEQTLRDALPRPALDRNPPRGGSERSPLVGGQRQKVVELLLELHRVALRERGELAVPLAVGGLEPLGNLRQPRVTGDDGRASGGRCLGGDHPERLGEDRGHDDGIGERDQVDEMAVLELSREQRAGRSQLLEALRGSRRSRR